MKRICISFLLLGIICFSAFAFNPDDLNLIYFENSTGSTIEFIFLSPGDSEYWGPEILGSERILANGDILGFYILYPNACDEFDIMAIDEDEQTLIIYNYEICDTDEGYIEILPEYLTEEAPSMNFVEIHIRNETILVYYIFISPSDSEMWGVDYLDETTILDTEDSLSLVFPVGDEPTEYDLKAIDEDGDAYQFSFDVDSDSDDMVFSIEISDLQ